MFEDMADKIANFRMPMDGDDKHRNWSWHHCYNFFQRYANDGVRDQNSRDLACLHLGFYLASWGMYRNSFILYKDYKVFEGIVEIILSQEYEEIWDPNYYNPLLAAEDEITVRSDEVIGVFGLYQDIKQYFDDQTFIRDFANPLEQHAKATDTLVTKIMLGTMCCTPAYDSILKKGLRAKNIRYRSNFNERSLASLLEACRRENLLERISALNLDGEYPIMKLVDMYFWEVGLEAPAAEDQ
ncbi:MAG: hypothetical protein CEE38_13720 [Planctomycetes bacterium B3_Pla]|nr:MAG: hypothetical protein CEE38_13720 [Planctomycetes bacterium B3_Pla]